MKGRKIITILIIVNLIFVGIIYNLLSKVNVNNQKVIVKAMTGTEYENYITYLNKSHEDYAKSVEESKKKIASAIREKGIETSNEETLENMANNIKSIPVNSGYKLEKIKITNITTTSTLAAESRLERLYDGESNFDPNLANQACYAINSNTIKLNVTVDKPFQLVFVRTPYLSKAGVYNPVRFTIGNYTSTTVSRDTNTWATIPYVPNDNFEFLSLGTTFEIDLYSGGEHTGATEFELYGFYE